MKFGTSREISKINVDKIDLAPAMLANFDSVNRNILHVGGVFRPISRLVTRQNSPASNLASQPYLKYVEKKQISDKELIDLPDSLSNLASGF